MGNSAEEARYSKIAPGGVLQGQLKELLGEDLESHIQFTTWIDDHPKE